MNTLPFLSHGWILESGVINGLCLPCVDSYQSRLNHMSRRDGVELSGNVSVLCVSFLSHRADQTARS